jgi:tRNA nucleotidyltransferase (CCA-adding enzyme)
MGSLPVRLGLAYLAWLVHSPLEDGQEVINRLRLGNDLQDALAAAKKLLEDLPGLAGARPSQVTLLLDKAPPTALYLVDLLEPGEEVRGLLQNYLQQWRDRYPLTDGFTLREMNLPPGPQYRYILSALRAAWLDGEIHSAEEEQGLLRELVNNTPG